MIDNNIIQKISDAAKIKASDLILEVGPGMGVLTEVLLKSAGRVIAVELDKKVLAFLRDHFAKEIESGKLVLVENDILKTNLPALGLQDFNFKIVCNLPYSITSKFFRQFLEFGPKPSEITVMIQKEVAERMISPAGEMNLLALSTQFFSEPEILFTVAPTCFWPEPEVDSAVIRLQLKKSLPEVDVKMLFRLARLGFASKRKQLQNNLSNGLKIKSGEVKAVLEGLGLREDIRAQDLSVQNWVDLTKNIDSGSSRS